MAFDPKMMVAVVQEAIKIKEKVAEDNRLKKEAPEVVAARDEALRKQLNKQWLERTLREQARSRKGRIVFRGAGIDDGFAKLLAKELGAMSAEVASEHVEVAQSTERTASDHSAQAGDLLEEDVEQSEPEEEEERVPAHLRDVRWKELEALDGGDWHEDFTSDSDSERSYRFTPRDERPFDASEDYRKRGRRLTAVYVPPAAQLEQLEVPSPQGCHLLDLAKNTIGGKGCAVCPDLRSGSS